MSSSGGSSRFRGSNAARPNAARPNAADPNADLRTVADPNAGLRTVADPNAADSNAAARIAVVLVSGAVVSRDRHEGEACAREYRRPDAKKAPGS